MERCAGRANRGTVDKEGLKKQMGRNREHKQERETEREVKAQNKRSVKSTEKQ